MGRRGVIAVAVVLFVGVVVAAASSGDVPLVSGPPSLSWSLGRSEPPALAVEVDAPMEPLEPLELVDEGSSGLLGTIVMVLLIAAAACVVVLAAVQLWRNRPRLVWRRPRTRDDFDVLAEAVAAIAADVDAQRAALLRGTPRNAIVECWSRLEASVIAAGVPRHAADTSSELTERVLAGSLVDATVIGRLAALYREARFSTHELGERERRAAIDALDAVHEGLHADVPA